MINLLGILSFFWEFSKTLLNELHKLFFSGIFILNIGKYAYRFICLYSDFYRVKYLKDEKFLKDFGSNLRKVRTKKSMTQEKLAFSVGIEISQISRIERGILNTSISTIKAIATALNIEVKDLFDF